MKKKLDSRLVLLCVCIGETGIAIPRSILAGSEGWENVKRGPKRWPRRRMGKGHTASAWDVFLQADGHSLCSCLERIDPASPDPGRHLTTGTDEDFGRQRGTQGAVSRLFGSAASDPMPSPHRELGSCSNSLPPSNRQAQLRAGLLCPWDRGYARSRRSLVPAQTGRTHWDISPSAGWSDGCCTGATKHLSGKPLHCQILLFDHKAHPIWY